MHACTYEDVRNYRIASVLQRFLYFKYLDTDSIKEVVYNFKIQHYKDNDLIFGAGSTNCDLGLVVGGFANFEFFTQGFFVPVKMIRRGALLNYDRAAVRKRQVLHLRAVEHTSIAWISTTDFFTMC